MIFVVYLANIYIYSYSYYGGKEELHDLRTNFPGLRRGHQQ